VKIAYITSVFPRLHNTFILNEILNLVNHGHDVTVFSVNKSYEKIVNEGVKKLLDKTFYFHQYTVKKDRSVLFFLFKVVRRISKRKSLLRKLFLEIFFSKDLGGLDVDKYFRYFDLEIIALNKISKKLKNEKYEIIHAAFGNRPATSAMLISRKTGIPFTFEVHAYDLFVDFPFAKEKLSEAKKVFTISHYNKKYIVETYNCDPKKIQVVRVPINDSHCDKVYGADRDNNTVLSVCRLHPIKGLFDAIEAFKKLSEINKNAKYIILGDGPLREALEKHVKDLSLSGKVMFVGDVSNEVALKHIAECTVFLLPSVIAADGDRDGIPTSLIEAMYLKTPVISTCVSGIPELITDKESGFLVNSGDVENISSRLIELFDNTSLRQTIGENARAKVLKDFNVKDNTEVLSSAWLHE